MRIALIADVHANLPALEAVVADAKAAYATTFICAGDVVGFGPHPKECVDMVRGLCQVTTSGNHDRALGWSEDCRCHPALAGIARAAEAYAREQLYGPDVQWLAGMGHEAGLYIGGKELFIVHGSPGDPLYTGIKSDEDPQRLRMAFSTIDCDFAVLGHTHQQMVLRDVVPGATLINPGTVGFPLDGDPRAAYVLLDLDEGSASARRAQYDPQEVVKDLRYLDSADKAAMETIYRTGSYPR
jgi:putative phosphoesterase